MYKDTRTFDVFEIDEVEIPSQKGYYLDWSSAKHEEDYNSVHEILMNEVNFYHPFYVEKKKSQTQPFDGRYKVTITAVFNSPQKNNR